MNFYTACSKALEYATVGDEPKTVEFLRAAIPLRDAACADARKRLELATVEDLGDAYERTLANAARRLYLDNSPEALLKLKKRIAQGFEPAAK